MDFLSRKKGRKHREIQRFSSAQKFTKNSQEIHLEIHIEIHLQIHLEIHIEIQVQIHLQIHLEFLTVSEPARRMCSFLIMYAPPPHGRLEIYMSN